MKKKFNVDSVMAIVILLLTVILILHSLVSNAVPSVEEDEGTVNEMVKRTILFNDITTTKDEYTKLRKSCKDFVRNNDTVVSNIDTEVAITEKTYIDKNRKTIKNYKDDTMHETGPVYFQDKLLIRYINEKGEMKVVASKLIKETTIKENEQKEDSEESLVEKIETVGSTELASIFNKQTIDENMQTFSTMILEDEYTSDLEAIFSEILRNSSENITGELKEKALNYFTYDGYLTIVDGIKHLDMNSTDINISCIEAGKSDINLEYKDRVLMQIITTKGNKTVYTNIVIKLDEKQKVFDIDII